MLVGCVHVCDKPFQKKRFPRRWWLRRHTVDYRVLWQLLELTLPEHVQKDKVYWYIRRGQTGRLPNGSQWGNSLGWVHSVLITFIFAVTQQQIAQGKEKTWTHAVSREPHCKHLRLTEILNGFSQFFLISPFNKTTSMSLSKSDSDLNFKTKNEYADFIRVKKRKVNLPSKAESKGLKNGCNDLKIASVSRSLWIY